MGCIHFVEDKRKDFFVALYTKPEIKESIVCIALKSFCLSLMNVIKATSTPLRVSNGREVESSLYLTSKKTNNKPRTGLKDITNTPRLKLSNKDETIKREKTRTTLKEKFEIKENDLTVEYMPDSISYPSFVVEGFEGNFQNVLSYPSDYIKTEYNSHDDDIKEGRSFDELFDMKHETITLDEFCFDYDIQ
jgi:hypothetical protein